MDSANLSPNPAQEEKEEEEPNRRFGKRKREEEFSPDSVSSNSNYLRKKMKEDNAVIMSDSDTEKLLRIMASERKKKQKASFCCIRSKLGQETGNYYNVRLLSEVYREHLKHYMNFLKHGSLSTNMALQGNKNIVAEDIIDEVKFVGAWRELFNDLEVPSNVCVERKVFTGKDSHEHSLKVWWPEMGNPNRSRSRSRTSSHSSASEGISGQRFHPYETSRNDKLSNNTRIIMKRLEHLSVPTGLIYYIGQELKKNVSTLEYLVVASDKYLLHWLTTALNRVEMDNFYEEWKRFQ